MANGANYNRGKLHHSPWHSDIRTSNQRNRMDTTVIATDQICTTSTMYESFSLIMGFSYHTIVVLEIVMIGILLTAEGNHSISALLCRTGQPIYKSLDWTDTWLFTIRAYVGGHWSMGISIIADSGLLYIDYSYITFR